MLSETLMINSDATQPLYLKIALRNIIASIAIVIVSTVLGSWFVTTSILIGAVIGTVNFYLLTKSVKNTFSGKLQKAKISIIRVYYLRFVAIVVIIGFLIFKNMINPVGFIIGFSAIVMTTLATTLYFVKKGAV